jgi:hypothetical protein
MNQVLTSVLLLLAILAGSTDLASAREARPAAIATMEVAGDCSSCGKSIYFGERCMTCISKEAKASHSHACEGCEKGIFFGSFCAMCTFTRAKDGMAHGCETCDAVIYLGSTCASCTAGRMQKRVNLLLSIGSVLAPVAKAELDRLLAELEQEFAGDGQAGGEPDSRTAQAKADVTATLAAFKGYGAAAAKYTKETGIAIAEKTADLKVKERAATVVGVAVETARVLETTKRTLAVGAFATLGAVPVHTELGWTSLSDLATFKLLEIAPEMKDTDLAKDPAAVLASLVVADHMYLLMDLKLVATEEGPLSIMDFLATKGDTNSAKKLAATTALVSIRRIRSGEALSKSVRDLARAIEVLAEPLESTLETD